MQVGHLHNLGFDRSCELEDGGFRVCCSQCEALVINGVPCHEHGCPNRARDQEEDEEEESWVDRHSVDCIRCGALVDERDTVPNTPEYGGDDTGGDICRECLTL